ncbi:MAG: hypothetical protein GF416_02035 [Candidatus Altiarchaeales archaeon]|nr:hypothetical protein [Candidatus Altiarchaeales archaeon]MBD3415897.1 hypothetical protein [Candidatus Altiarchaeales archaeon]
MYGDLLKGLWNRDSGDSVHAASVFAIEFQSIAAFLLLTFLAVRFISAYAALPAVLLALMLLRGRTLTFTVLRENDDRFQTLLFYLIVSLGVISLSVGWYLWV